MKPRTVFASLAALLCAGPSAAADLPPEAAVRRALLDAPSVQAADSGVRVEEANRRRLEAGPHEWTVRLGGQRRQVRPPGGPDERYREQEAALERALRLPGKAAADAELGERGVAVARTARGDALHEAGRDLLRGWFAWLRERETARQWGEQAALLDSQSRSVQRRRQLGDAARLDAVQAEAALLQAQAQLAQAQARARSAAESLRRRYPGLPLPDEIELSAPQPVVGEGEAWIARVLAHDHELALARAQAQRAVAQAARSGRERLPDPTLGLHVGRERGGEERLLGVSLSIPLPGEARRAGADAARAEADAAGSREAAALRKVAAEAAALFHAASAAHGAWEGSRLAAERLTQAADMSARAYQLGEGTLGELLTGRRLANEARLAARLAQIEALELRYRLLLDAHELWDWDDAAEAPAGR